MYKSLEETKKIVTETLGKERGLVDHITQHVTAHMEYGSVFGLDGMIALAIGTFNPAPSGFGEKEKE